MKQKLYILGISVILVILAGTLMKINHFAGAGMVITLGVIMLVLIFLPLALINNFRTENEKRNPLLYAVIFITGALVFASMLFKIMNWPGAGALLLIAIPFPYVVFLPVYLITTSGIKNYSIYNTVFVLFLLVFNSVLSVLLALNVSITKISQSLVMGNAYRETTAIIRQYSAEYSGEYGSTKHANLPVTADQLLATISQCREILVNKIGISSYPVNLNTNQLRKLDNKSVANIALLDQGNRAPAIILEKDIRNFIQALGELKGGKALADKASDLLLISRFNAGGDSWPQKLFGNEYLSWVLVYLDSMEANVLLLRKEALSLM